ncbi:MAG TPA: S8 family serine peptidase [Solirubrobacteraceae bacterium]|nr:S8 family serine peptidase [Solirubrobacteraceae bacterium]
MRRAIGIGTALLACLACMSSSAAAAPRYDAHTVIVKYANGATSSQRSLSARLAGVLETLGSVRGIGAQVVRVSGDPAAVAKRLGRSQGVLYAEPNYFARATGVPNDPRFAGQYALHNSGQGGGAADADIDAPEGWTTRFGATSFPSTGGAKVGIVDTGVLAGHEDLAGKVVNCAGVRSFGIDVLGMITLPIFADATIVNGRCADDNGHGTHVAGIAAANANNGRGIAGVAFDSPLAICKALDRNGAGPVAGIANCIGYLAANGARVISMSLGTNVDSVTLRNAVIAASSSALVVAASGNTGTNVPQYPAFYPEAVSVAATDNRDQRAVFSTFNGDVEVAAPGANILSTSNNGGYKVISGTSMATPHAAGVAAVIAGRYPSQTPTFWRGKLDSAVDDVAAAGRDQQTGFGRVNLQQAATE